MPLQSELTHVCVLSMQKGRSTHLEQGTEVRNGLVQVLRLGSQPAAPVPATEGGGARLGSRPRGRTRAQGVLGVHAM